MTSNVYDIHRAIAQINSIPMVKESIPELTSLANGSNPNIPKYLALGKLNQITELVKSAAAESPPQGTIKDKLTQAGGLMALKGGRGQQATQNMMGQAMDQPGPAPEGVPQPPVQKEALPEEVMMAADGGIMSADIDPRMFQFDGGGIVTFANPEKEKKQQVKDKNKEEEETTSTIGNLLRSFGSGLDWYDSLPSKTDTYKLGQQAREAFEKSPGLFEQLTDPQRAAKERAAAQVWNPPVQVSPEETQQRNAQANDLMRAQYEKLKSQGFAGNSPPQMPQPPAPAAGGINDGKTRIPGAPVASAAPAAPQVMPQNEFLDAARNAIKETPEVFNEAAEAAKIAARNKAAGIGTYADLMRGQQANMRSQFEASRPDTTEKLIDQMRAYARPGARAGDVGGIAGDQMRGEREARMQFAQDQFKITDAIEKLEEARRTNDVQAIAAAEATLKKANADKKAHQMTLMGTAGSTLGHLQGIMATNASHEKVEANRLAVEKLKVAAMNKEPAAIRLFHELEVLYAAGKPQEAKDKLERYAQASAADKGIRYTGKDTAATPLQINDAIRKEVVARNPTDILNLNSSDKAKAAKARANIKATEDRVRAELTPPAESGDGNGKMSIQDQKALEWANDHPADPRAAQIKQQLGK